VLQIEVARLRVEAILGEIQRLKELDFPYDHSKDALSEIEKQLQRRLIRLNALGPKHNEAVIRVFCQESLVQVDSFLPLLGFIVRSTHVRNSFEVFGPLLRLARQILAADVKLIVSSEWHYSPHVYNPISDLPDYVLLGLPASESGNPLLIPIAGHELGHTAWQRRDLAAKYGPRLAALVVGNAKAEPDLYKKHFGSNLNDLFLSQNLAPAYELALKQAEESFCDFAGLRIFSESYLYAYAYLCLPGGFHRSWTYPSSAERIGNIVKASADYNVDVPPEFEKWFEDDKSSAVTDKEEYLLRAADKARQMIVTDLIAEAESLVTQGGIPGRSASEISRVLNSFKQTTPASNIENLSSLLNAAWTIFFDPGFWGSAVDNRIDFLYELVLKSFEIMEYERRVK
jgi:hypothetical protein